MNSKRAKTKTINNWSIFSLYTSYLKRNKAIFISMFVIPIIFVGVGGISYYRGIASISSNVVILGLLVLWILQSATFALQTFLSILLDFKQTIIYRRIGLTRIKKLNFLIMSSLFNLLLVLISNLFIFLVIIILLAAFNLTTVLKSIFSWELILIILLTLACLVLFTAITLIMSVFIKTRTGQTIASIIVTFLITIPLTIIVVFLSSIITSKNDLQELVGLSNLLLIFFASFIGINLISVLLYYLSWKYFQWYE